MIFIVNTKIDATYEIVVEAKNEKEAQKFVDSLSVEQTLTYGNAFVYEGPNDKSIRAANEDEKRLVRHPVYLEDGEIA